MVERYLFGRRATQVVAVALATTLAAIFCSPALAQEVGPENEREELEERTLVGTGPEGILSTFRVITTSMAPRSSDDEASFGSFCDETVEGCSRPPRVTVSDSGLLDLSSIGGRGHKVVYLGARLRAPHKTTLNLFVGARGEVSVQLDGSEVLQHTASQFSTDQSLARLSLTPGDHALVLRFARPRSGRWRAKVRFLDERYRPGLAKVEMWIGRLGDDRASRLAAEAVHIEEVHQLGEAGPEVVLSASLPGGGVARPVDIELGGPHSLRPTGSILDGTVEHRLPFPAKGKGLSVTGRAGARVVKLGRWIALDRPVLAAQAAIEATLENAPEASRAPLMWRSAELARIVKDHDPDRAWRRALALEAKRLVKSVEGGGDPFAAIKGYRRMAFISRLDGTAQPYELFVPPAYDPEKGRRWPLVITLHGFKGNAGDYFRNTFGLARDYEGGETLLAHGRQGKAPRRGPMFVVAPSGRGQAMYRHAGEIDVLEALADVQARFDIDPNRIYITGGSMGGTGAAYIPYRNPDLFAASAALAGYHDQRVRHDTNHEELSKVERFLQAERSDVDWAENGLHMPTLLIRGTKDRPLDWTRSLARRLDELNYPFEHREPELGHNVWTEAYAKGAIFRYFAQFKRQETPRKVHLRTARERTNHAWWVAIDRRASSGVFADVNAWIDDDRRAVVQTGGVRALTLSPGDQLVPEGPLRVEIDGQFLSGSRPLSLYRSGDGQWEIVSSASPPVGHKKQGVSGPIRDVYHEPLIFVVGTQHSDHRLINRVVAQHWARPRGWVVSYPIVDDVNVTEAMIRDHNLVLIGPPSSNLLTRRWASSLPIRFEGETIRVGRRRYGGVQTGAVFVAPNPDVSDQALLVIAGPNPLGTWRSRCLPDILPDYVIFDERIAPARDRWAIGGTGATALETGLFTMDWAIPESP